MFVGDVGVKIRVFHRICLRRLLAVLLLLLLLLHVLMSVVAPRIRLDACGVHWGTTPA